MRRLLLSLLLAGAGAAPTPRAEPHSLLPKTTPGHYNHTAWLAVQKLTPEEHATASVIASNFGYHEEHMKQHFYLTGMLSSVAISRLVDESPELAPEDEREMHVHVVRNLFAHHGLTEEGLALRPALLGFFDDVADAASSAVDAVGDAAASAANAVAEAANKAADAAMDAAMATYHMTKAAYNAAKDGAETAFNAVKAGVGAPSPSFPLASSPPSTGPQCPYPPHPQPHPPHPRISRWSSSSI